MYYLITWHALPIWVISFRALFSNVVQIVVEPFKWMIQLSSQVLLSIYLYSVRIFTYHVWNHCDMVFIILYALKDIPSSSWSDVCVLPSFQGDKRWDLLTLMGWSYGNEMVAKKYSGKIYFFKISLVAWLNWNLLYLLYPL